MKDRETRLRSDHSFAAVGFGAGEGYVVALAVETDDEHGASVAFTDRLVGGEHGRVSALGSGIADALTEAAVTEFIGTSKEFDGIVGAVGSQGWLHGAVMLVAKGQNVCPHSKRVYTIESLRH